MSPRIIWHQIHSRTIFEISTAKSYPYISSDLVCQEWDHGIRIFKGLLDLLIRKFPGPLLHPPLLLPYWPWGRLCRGLKTQPREGDAGANIREFRTLHITPILGPCWFFSLIYPLTRSELGENQPIRKGAKTKHVNVTRQRKLFLIEYLRENRLNL